MGPLKRSMAERPPASVPVEFMAPVVGAILSKVSAGADVRTTFSGVSREFFREPARTETGAVAGLGWLENVICFRFWYY